MIASNHKKMIFSAMLLALSYVLPFLTGQIQQIGNMLCPMHLPVILCGFICGWQWGLVVGLVAPLLRSLTLGMPPLFPLAISMSVELMVYGAVSGLLYKLFPKKRIYIYLSLVCAMICGRIAWGAVRFMLSGFDSTAFSPSMFISGAVTTAIPGIVIQLVLVPLVVMLAQKAEYKHTI